MYKFHYKGKEVSFAKISDRFYKKMPFLPVFCKLYIKIKKGAVAKVIEKSLE